MRNISTNISTLGQRTHLKLGELSSLFIVYNITIFWLYPMRGFCFYFLLRDNAHTRLLELGSAHVKHSVWPGPYLAWRQCKLTGIAYWKQATFLTEDGIKYSRKGIYNSPNPSQIVKSEKIWNILCLQISNLGHEWVASVWHGNSLNSLVVRRLSPGRVIVVLFWAKYAVPLFI